MNKLLALLIALVFAATATLALAEGAALALKAGDSIYACGCGAGCKCRTISNKEGKCGCGKPLVKTSVTKVEDGKAYYQIDGKEIASPTTGKYTCACGSSCGCATISQKPGTCGCGNDMKKVD